MPDVPGDEAAELLDQAEDIVNAVGPEMLAEVRERGRAQTSGPAGGGAAQPLSPARPAPVAQLPGERPPGRFSMKAVIASTRSSEARNAGVPGGHVVEALGHRAALAGGQHRLGALDGQRRVGGDLGGHGPGVGQHGVGVGADTSLTSPMASARAAVMSLPV